MNNFFSPAEICENMVNGCNNKAKLPISKMLVLGIFAGVFIGFGAYGFTVVTSAAGTGFEATVAKLLGAGIFPAGLVIYWVVSNIMQILQQWWMYRGDNNSKKEAA